MSDDSVFDPSLQDTYNTRRTNWTRWIPEPIQDTVVPSLADTPSDTSDDVGTKLKNTLSRLRQQANKKGYDEGYAKGHAEGLQQGLTKGHEQGIEDGYRAGYETGHNEGKHYAEQAADELAELTRQCAAALTDIETDIGQNLIRLSIRIAEQVLHQTLDTDPKAILPLVDDILRLDTGKSTALQLYVNPDDLTLIKNYLHDNPDTRMWHVHADKTIARGGCIARTALGDIDATLEKRWQRVISAIGGTS